jgi:azurin
MKFRTLTLFVSLAALMVAGCGKKETATAAAPAAPAPASAPAADGVRVIKVTANDQMKFNLSTIELKVGEEVKITLTNIGTMPKQAMGHNLVVLKPGTDETAFATAAGPATATEHIPESMKDQVVAHTKMLGPKESDSITLKFDEAGNYPFMCSFPAHFQLGMKGNIVVK